MGISAFGYLYASIITLALLCGLPLLSYAARMPTISNMTRPILGHDFRCESTPFSNAGTTIHKSARVELKLIFGDDLLYVKAIGYRNQGYGNKAQNAARPRDAEIMEHRIHKQGEDSGKDRP